MLFYLLIISVCHAIYPGFGVARKGTKGVQEPGGSFWSVTTPLAVPLHVCSVLKQILKVLLSE